MIGKSKILNIISFFLVSLIFSYLILIKLGLSEYAQLFRISQLILIIVVSIFYLLKNNFNIPGTLNKLFFIYLIFFLCYSFILNPASIGSILKYLSYILIYFVVYNIPKLYDNIPYNKNHLNVLSIIVFLIGSFQLITGDLQYLNMVKRVSGTYYLHASGFALFLIFPISYYIFISKSIYRFPLIIIGTYILFRTGGRSAFLAFLLAYLIVFFKNYKFYFSIITTLFVSLFVVYFWDQILSLESFVRWKYLIESGNDGSTITRFNYFYKSISNFNLSFFGNGAGSFPFLYEEAFGKRLGAHNNFLMFLIEWGYFGLVLYTLHLVYLFFKVINLNSPLLLFLFIAFYLGGIFNNNYYYPAPMIIFLSLYSYKLSNEKNKIQI